MKKLFIITLFIFACTLPPTIAGAGTFNVLIYCNFRAPAGEEIKEHWKPEIPDVGVDEVIRDFRLIAKQGAKRFYHALVYKSADNSKQFARIKTYIDNFNDGKPINQRILFWHSKTARQVYKNLWLDRTTDPFIETIAKRVLRYPVQTTCDGEPCTRIVTVEEAETTYGESIDAQKILMPHSFFGA
jgi:hypothetical protein